jgi:hypothetical protein
VVTTGLQTTVTHPRGNGPRSESASERRTSPPRCSLALWALGSNLTPTFRTRKDTPMTGSAHLSGPPQSDEDRRIEQVLSDAVKARKIEPESRAAWRPKLREDFHATASTLQRLSPLVSASAADRLPTDWFPELNRSAA